MQNKRPIDRIRDSAVSMSVGGPDDASAITAMVPLEGILHIVKEKGIYACKLADSIDPGRTNPQIPNVQQKVLALGSDSPLVGKTLLTARELFHKQFLPGSFDCEAGLMFVFNALKDLAAMDALAERFQTAQAASQLEDRRGRDRSVVLPSVGDVSDIAKSFLQKADHTLQALLGIVKLFYGEAAGKAWFESFAQLAARNYGTDDQFSRFLAEVLPLVQFVRNARNCVEHPKPQQRVVVADFALNAAMRVAPPMIEIIHPKSHQLPMPLEKFMREVTEQITGVFELMVVLMCAKHVQSIGGFPLGLIQLPENQRRYKHVQYCYGTPDGIPMLSPG